MKKRILMTLIAVNTAILSGASGAEMGSASSVPTTADTTSEDGRSLNGSMTIEYAPIGWDLECTVSLNGTELLLATNRGSFTWQPRQLGANVLEWSSSGVTMKSTVNVVGLDYFVQPEPNPPMPVDANISITPVTRTFEQGGGGGSIVTSGSGTWTAAVSDSWIVLNTTSGNAGIPVAYVVNASGLVGDRIGYVYVSGRVHTVTQHGYASTISPASAEFETQGGSGSVAIQTTSRIAWNAKPNVDWISISPTSGSGPGKVSYTVAPYNEVATRTGTITVGDQTFTVTQTGRRIKLSTYREVRTDYFSHVIPVTVNALSSTHWSVTPNATWISVVDAGNGVGSDSVSLAIADNLNGAARYGTVTIGTETLLIVQGEPITILPETATAAVGGANGFISVGAWPEVSWIATIKSNWLSILGNTAQGTGCGNVVYTASPNPTLYERTGIIEVAENGGQHGYPVRTHTVTQPAATASLSSGGYEFEAGGGSFAVTIDTASIVEWKVDGCLDWLTVPTGLEGVGSQPVRLQASANNTIYPRSVTLKIAENDFVVTQKGRGVEVEYDSILFGTDGGLGSFSIHPDGDVAWNAVSSDPTWITVFQNESGTGDAVIQYIVSPYVDTGAARTGYIEVGDKKVYITQRPYEMNIDPYLATVTGDAGSGQVGISAPIGSVWEAVATEPWIRVMTRSGSGNGTVTYQFTENLTGKVRTGKIIISGEEYTINQMYRVVMSVDVEGRGSVTGAGAYDYGAEVTLTATPEADYSFSHWSGAANGTDNPVTIKIDEACKATAHFVPLTPEFTKAESSTDGVALKWLNLAWAVRYNIYRAPSSQIPDSALATVVADGTCEYFDASGEVGQTYWYWVEAVGATDTTECKQPVSGTKQKPIVISPITYANLHGATHANPETYQEGTVVAFTPPSGRTGYTFMGWTPAAITAEMTGAQTVTAGWRANSYQIAYYANGGSGTMTATDCNYDQEGEIAANGFTRSGYVFKGWATEEDGEVVYQPGDKVTNLTSNDSGVVKLYAVWEVEVLENPVITPGNGTIFMADSCMVSISCATEGATIYYSTTAVPRPIPGSVYSAPFEISKTTTVYAFAKKGDQQSATVMATITKKTLTLAEAAGAADLSFTTGGLAAWRPTADATTETGFSARSGTMPAAETGTNESWMELTVSGAGTLTFNWRVDCEDDGSDTATWDHLAYSVDGEEIDGIDGLTDWEEVTISFAEGGSHAVRWTYVKDYYDEPMDIEDCGWVEGVVWTPSAAPETKPIVEGDKGATVTGDAETGFVVKPSEGKTAVEVTIPQGVDAAKVTVEVSPKVASVKPNGAKVKVVSGGADITEYLNVPAADGNGVVNLAKATVKEEIVREAMDTEKGAKIELNAADPKLITPNTRVGLFYQLREGVTLEGMSNGDSTIGDGNPWKPEIKVKGGNSAFYSIGVGKGE